MRLLLVLGAATPAPGARPLLAHVSSAFRGLPRMNADAPKPSIPQQGAHTNEQTVAELSGVTPRVVRRRASRLSPATWPKTSRARVDLFLPGYAAARQTSWALAPHVRAPTWARSLRSINRCHAINALLNLAAVPVTWNAMASRIAAPAAGGHDTMLLTMAAFGMSFNNLCLAYEQAALAAGRAIMLHGSGGEALLRELTRWRCLLHCLCGKALFVIPLFVLAASCNLGHVSSPGLLAYSLSAAAFSAHHWLQYDTSRLQLETDDDPGANGRGVYSYTSKKIVLLVVPNIICCLACLFLGTMLMKAGSMTAGMSVLTGAIIVLAASANRTKKWEAWGETALFAGTFTAAMLCA